MCMYAALTLLQLKVHSNNLKLSVEKKTDIHYVHGQTNFMERPVHTILHKQKKQPHTSSIEYLHTNHRKVIHTVIHAKLSMLNLCYTVQILAFLVLGVSGHP